MADPDQSAPDAGKEEHKVSPPEPKDVKEDKADGDSAKSGKASAEDTADAAKAADERLGEELRENARYVNVQYFQGTVNAAGSTFGQPIGSTAGRLSATGPVTADEVRLSLQYLVKPSSYGRALSILRTHRLVVLSGPAGIGKYTSGLALLRDATGPGVLPTNLSPALAFAELAAQKFGNDGGYLVRDHLTDTNATAVQQFDVHRLRSALEHRSYLVITTDLGLRPRGPLAEYMVDLDAPDSVTVFERCIEALPADVLATAETERIRQKICKLTSPRDVVAIGRTMVDGPEKALAALEHSQRDRVIAWFDDSPTARDVLTVAALSFLEGISEPMFEHWQARLVELHRGEVALDTTGRNGATTMQQSRVWNRSDSLIAVSYPQDEVLRLGERCLAFKGQDMRPLVIQELYERYGYELWQPIRTWLQELAENPPSPTHVRIALGMALWSRCNFREVEQTFLDVWADGEAAERLAAACTLSWIGMDGTHASMALRLCKRWAQNSGPRRAVTAASALGGPLGLRYQSDALRWLWTLAMRSERIRNHACIALGLLFATAADEPENAKRVLNFMRARLHKAITDGSSQRDRRVTFTTILGILDARDPETDTPLVTKVLSTSSEQSGAHDDEWTEAVARNADRFGELWAELLCSGPHKREAQSALLTALKPLSGDTDVLPAIERLGGAIRARLTEDQWVALRESLNQESRLRAEDEQETFAAVLAALCGTTGALRRAR